MDNKFNNYPAAIYGPINNWDVSQVTNMSQLFKDKTTFNDNISEWDVSNVTHMETMFNSATSFNKPLNDWNVSNVENMKDMFASQNFSIKTFLVGMCQK